MGFVIGRIEEQAMRSGEPLSEEQCLLLNNLPKTSSLPEIGTGDPDSAPLVTPRDPAFERLCALAKSARRSDLDLNPSSLDWDFSFAVLKLNRHPMCWLLQWGGMKQRKPWWDVWLLIVAAILLIVSQMALIFLLGLEPWSVYKWIGLGVGSAALIRIAYLVARRLEDRQLERNIERFRPASRFIHSVSTG